MLNKTILLLILISNLFILNAFSNDQISFDVSEIEILDNGNKIIGKNRGTITTNNGITIEADRFEFDKVKNILKAQNNIIIEDTTNNYNLFAQDILYFKNEERIEIKGNAEALIETNYKFNTQDIIILRNEMMISSDVGATITDQLNQTRYEIGKFSYALEKKILKKICLEIRIMIQDSKAYRRQAKMGSR